MLAGRMDIEVEDVSRARDNVAERAGLRFAVEDSEMQHPLHGAHRSKPQPPQRAMARVLGAIAALGAVVALSGCADDLHLRSAATIDDPCGVAPGQMPRADCAAPADVASVPPATMSCELAPSCGDANTCLPLARNQGRTEMDFRVRQLSVVAPRALREGPVQAALVRDRVDLDQRQCAEHGTGLFNWLLRVDRTTGTLTTGGAPPADPTDGYCFARFSTLRGAPASAARAPIAWDRTAFTTTAPMDIRLPVFHTSDPRSAQVLSIHDARFADVALSTEDCIGTFNRSALDGTCAPTGRDKWTSGGALAGYMTLKEADEIVLPDLSGDSLCVVLLGASARDDATHRCARDAQGNLPALGDYCGQTKAAGDCRDSVWFAATFAASAVKIHDGTGVPACSGAQM